MRYQQGFYRVISTLCLCFILGSICSICHAAETRFTPIGYLLCSDLKPDPSTYKNAAATTIVRDRRMILYARQNETIYFSVKCQERWTRPGAAVLFLQNEDWQTLFTMKALSGEEKEFAFTVPAEGVYYVQAAGGLTACTVKTSAMRMYEASEIMPLSFYPKQGPLYFYIPAKATEFSICLSAAEPGASKVQVLAPDGTEIVNKAVLESGLNEIKVQVTPEMAGQTGTFIFTGPVNYGESSVYLKGVFPYFADTPENLFIPCAEAALRAVTNDNELLVQFPLGGQEYSGMEKCTVVLKDEKDEVFREDYAAVPEALKITIPDAATPKIYWLEVTLAAGTEKIASFKKKMAISHHRFFYQIDRDVVHTLPKPLEQEVKRGYMLFDRVEPGSIYAASVPLRTEIIETIRVTSALGQYEPFHFALHALEDLKEVNISISALTQAGGAVIPSENIDLRLVKFWLQRVTLDNTPRYHEIPEILESLQPVDISQGHNALFYAIIKIPADAKPGTYNAAVTVTSRGPTATPLAVALTVLPFELQMPTDIRWMMDTSISQHRWITQAYTLPRIRRELQAIHAYGINTLGLWPQYKFVNDDKTLKIEYGQATQIMALYQETGFLSPMIVEEHGGMESAVLGIYPNGIAADGQEYTAEAKALYEKLMSEIAATAKENNWPEQVYLTVDEPGYTKEGLDKFIRTAKAVRAAGFKTLTTCGTWYVDQIDPYLDYRCFSNISYASSTSKEINEALRLEAQAAGDAFWFYAGGSYANDGILHEGIMAANRYQNGVFMWRNGSAGMYNWISCWPMGGDKIDDFDNCKDSCTYYPPNHENEALVPTLQMEGIREGIKDYQYLYMLKALIEEKKVSNNSDEIEVAGRIEKELTIMLDELPWMHAIGEEYPPQTITNEMLQNIRIRVISMMNQLAD